MLMSLAVVFFGMQLMMVGPLKGRLDGIQTRLDLGDQNLKQLVGAQDGVTEANSLLTDLQEQSNRLIEMQQTIDRIASLRQKMESEAQAATLAMNELDKLTAVQERIIASREETDAAVAQIARLEELRTDIIDGQNQTQVADNSLDGILALQKRVIAASSSYEQASTSIANLADLTQRLIDSDENLQVASEKFDNFIGLQNRMIASAENHDKADESLRTLVAMNNTLSSDSLKLDAAGDSLDQIIALNGKLSSQSSRVAAAIQNLELMDDFHTEVAAHIHSLTGLRRTLMDLAMMETTIGRVAAVISPLSEIGNLRRLSESEVREAARVILSQRTSRSSSQVAMESDVASESVDSTELQEDSVPLPPEARDLN